MKFIHIGIVFFLSILFLSHTLAQNNQQSVYFNADRISNIDQYVKESMSDNRVPGTSIALIESGKIVYIKGYGVADSSGTKVTPETPFQLASITKSFTALLMVQLEEEGKLQLSDSVTQYISWFETSKPKQANSITLRHLLQHNSGLSNAVGNLSQNSSYRGADATELAVKKLLHAQLLFEPGAGFHYSNANYHLATHIIELLEKKPFEQVMLERILVPLGMKNSYVQMTNNETKKEASGFPHWFGFPIERPFILGRMKMGDGGMTASAEDLATYLIAVANAETSVISKGMRAKLLNTEFNSAEYGLGWSVITNDDGLLYEHSGGNGGFSSYFGFTDATSKRDDIGFVILSNSSSSLYDRFAYDLRSVILNKEPVPAKPNMFNLVSLIWLYIGSVILMFVLYREIFRPKIRQFNLKLIIAPVVLLCLSYFNAFTVPSMNGINLLSIFPFFPDLMVGLLGFSVLTLILALVKIGRLIKTMLDF